MNEQLINAVKTNDLPTILAFIPYAQTIGMTALHKNNQILYQLPARESNIGNPTLPALHGGCIGGFMETAAIIEVILSLNVKAIPKVINFSLDYLRPGRFKDSYAACQIIRQGSKVVNVAVTAWQDDINEPISSARTHILL